MIWLAICIPVGVILIVALSVVMLYNSLVAKKNTTKQSFADIDVMLKKRYDLIPNLVNTVKGYASHEKETLSRVVELRKTAMGASTMNDKVKADNDISASIGSVLALSENYPDLKANENFLSLQQSLNDIERELATARLKYNHSATAYNTQMETFPGNVIAKIFKFEKCELFVIANPVERENIKVEF